MFKNKKPVIAIDGTAGSGKGTLAKKLASHFCFDHLDSGILYRIFAYEILSKNLKIGDVAKINIDFDLILNKKKLKSMKLRSEKITKFSSEIAMEEKVRKKLIFIQRKFSDFPPTGIGSVIDGRDITSVITPNAEVKFYIDADIKIRAKRRQNQLKLEDRFFNDVLEQLKNRDLKDKNRKLSPLKKTEDSFYLDTTKLDEDESFHIATDYIKKKLNFN